MKTNQPRVMRAFDAVVFDLFHTLVDPEEFRPKNARRTDIAARLLTVDQESFASYWSQTLPSRNTSRSETVTKLLQDYLARIGVRAERETLARVEFEMGRYQDLAILNPRAEILSTLEGLNDSGFKLGILSNCDEREIRQWSNSPLAGYFDAVCFSCDTGQLKPNREAFTTVLNRLGTSARRSVYVGDGGSNELQGAKQAEFGLVVFMAGFVEVNGLRRPDELKSFRKTADVVISRLSELLSAHKAFFVDRD